MIRDREIIFIKTEYQIKVKSETSHTVQGFIPAPDQHLIAAIAAISDSEEAKSVANAIANRKLFIFKKMEVCPKKTRNKIERSGIGNGDVKSSRRS